MARLRLTCCCGSSVEARSWPAPQVETAEWFRVHAFCANAWQREHGLDSRISFPDPDKEQD